MITSCTDISPLVLSCQLSHGPVLHSRGGLRSLLPPLPPHRLPGPQAGEPPSGQVGSHQDRGLRSVQVPDGDHQKRVRDPGVRGARDNPIQLIRKVDQDHAT